MTDSINQCLEQIRKVFKPEHFTVYSIYDMDSDYLFGIKDNRYLDENPMDPYYTLNKATGKIKGFQPHEDLKRFNKALNNKLYFVDATKSSKGELKHHGILGMSWGNRNGPPYPLDSGSHSTREKKAGWQKSLVAAGGAAAAGLKKKYKDVQTVQQAKAKARAEAQKKAQEEAEKKAKEKTKADIASAIRTGNRDEINRLKDNMTDAELSKALDRARLVDQIGRRTDAETERIIRSGDYSQISKNRDNMSYDELQNAVNRIDLNKRLDSRAPKDRSGWDKVDNAMRRLDQINQWADIGIKSYNNLAKVHNSVRPNDQPMPIINNGGKNKDKDKGKNDDKFSKKDMEKMMNEFSDKMQKEMEKLNRKDQTSSPDQNAGGNKKGKKDKSNDQQPQNPNPQPQQPTGNRWNTRPVNTVEEQRDAIMRANRVRNNPSFIDIYDTMVDSSSDSLDYELSPSQIRRGRDAYDFAVNTYEQASIDLDRYRS